MAYMAYIQRVKYSGNWDFIGEISGVPVPSRKEYQLEYEFINPSFLSMCIYLVAGSFSPLSMHKPYHSSKRLKMKKRTLLIDFFFL